MKTLWIIIISFLIVSLIESPVCRTVVPSSQIIHLERRIVLLTTIKVLVMLLLTASSAEDEEVVVCITPHGS